jgi:predicted nucleotidyltransferase component of viral defense system
MGTTHKHHPPPVAKAHSIRQRLLNLAHQQRQDFQEVLAYPPETVIAEKLEALVRFGLNTSRIKDIYDLWVLGQQRNFAEQLLCEAIQATFTRRNTPLPHQIPAALSEEFAQDRQKRTQWAAFLSKGHLSTEGAAFEQVLAFVRRFVLPPTFAAATQRTFPHSWLPGGSWQAAEGESA